MALPTSLWYLSYALTGILAVLASSSRRVVPLASSKQNTHMAILTMTLCTHIMNMSTTSKTCRRRWCPRILVTNPDMHPVNTTKPPCCVAKGQNIDMLPWYYCQPMRSSHARRTRRANKKTPKGQTQKLVGTQKVQVSI